MPIVKLLKEPPARKGFLPREKFDALLTHTPADLKPLVTFLYYCGVRLGEALEITWDEVDLNAATIRLEEDQTKSGEARIVPLPDVLIKMLDAAEPKTGTVFSGTNLRKEWHKACVAAGLGTLTEVEGKPDPRYTGLIIHDLRRSAIRNLMKSGTSERVAMQISGHKTRWVFDRYHIVDESDVKQAMARVEAQVLPATPVAQVENGESSVKVMPRSRPKKRLTA